LFSFDRISHRLYETAIGMKTIDKQFNNIL